MRIARPRSGGVTTLPVAAALLLALAPGEAAGGPHANGVLLAHLNPKIEYTSTVTSYEGMADLEECEKAIVEGRVDAERAQVWFVLASFEASPGPVELGGAGFGFGDYDASRLQFGASGPCNDGFLELPTSGWPGPREGTALLFDPLRPHREDVVELYWFASYAYGAVVVPLDEAPHYPPGEQFSMPNTGEPGESTVVDEAADFGSIGFGTPGYNPCGQGPAEGACCLFGNCHILSRNDCEDQGGIYRGDNTDCFPNPCEEDQVKTTWGVLKKLYE